MNKSVVVSIKREKDFVRVTNGNGVEWKIPCLDPENVDTSAAAAIAVVANSMLTGTIATQIQHSNAKEFIYKLTLNTA